jgi:hypothetical protein
MGWEATRKAVFFRTKGEIAAQEPEILNPIMDTHTKTYKQVKLFIYSTILLFFFKAHLKVLLKKKNTRIEKYSLFTSC